MVYDFGNAAGALSVPTDMKTNVFEPAYNQGARIFSNSWGSSAPYNYYDARAKNIDQYVYDSNDVLVLFSAGNKNSESDDTNDNGDGSIGTPGICKNVLTVGAAETEYTPTTLAYFSSRGPSRDMRIKPEVSAPGNPIISAKASGSAGLASCTTVSKSVSCSIHIYIYIYI
jgi:serine protease AprX